MNKFWTDKELEILRAMCQAKCRIEEVRDVLKSRTDDAIREKAYRLGFAIMEYHAEIDMGAFKRIMKERGNGSVGK